MRHDKPKSANDPPPATKAGDGIPPPNKPPRTMLGFKDPEKPFILAPLPPPKRQISIWLVVAILALLFFIFQRPG